MLAGTGGPIGPRGNFTGATSWNVAGWCATITDPQQAPRSKEIYRCRTAESF
jgi:hypothetical protein